MLNTAIGDEAIVDMISEVKRAYEMSQTVRST